ncbi:hypothetical protein [Phenylobacterium sp.]|uniref:hypothetical protein n=1 Tax=Phenylobacterium sp. TaxID=1871053 RepID=UPI0012057E35|nr:hypothetical protein [Phenylobacterium sp.]THD58793.1 MAG: hypothetical protein E8A49_17515 [Phenylobacterium sp.]
MSLETIAKLGVPIFALPFLWRFLVLGVLGAVLSIGAGEWVRAATYKPVSAETDVAKKTAAEHQRHAGPVPPAAKDKVPTKAPPSAAPNVSVGPVSSSNQTGGITAGYVGSVEQNASQPKR